MIVIDYYEMVMKHLWVALVIYQILSNQLHNLYLSCTRKLIDAI